MRKISGVRDIGIGEKAVVEKRAFENEVREGVKDVPDVNEADVERGGAGKEAEGGSVGDQEEGDGREEGEDRCEGEEGWVRSGHD